MITAGAEGIVWIASYPKSGNTWVRCLISSLFSDGAEPDLGELGNFCPNGADRQWLENILDIPTDDLTPQELVSARADAYRAVAEGKSLRCIKVHDCYDPELFPPEATAGIVYIVRDPRDVAPSFAHHFEVSLDEAITRMAKADFTVGRSINRLHPQSPQVYGAWASQAETWLESKAAPFLLLHYENLLTEPVAQVSRLAEFLGLGSDQQLAARAVQACSFDILRQTEAVAGFGERLGHMDHFFRQGKSGTWREVMNPAQEARILRDHGGTMRKLGY